MARPTAKLPQIGDIVEIVTSTGLAYAQYTHEHSKPPGYGSLLRVLPGVYPERPAKLSELCEKKEQFTMFFPLHVKLKQQGGVFKIIANEVIPEWAKPFPVFRRGLPDRAGKVHEWWLWDGEKGWKVGKLTREELHSYPYLGVANQAALIQMIENGWTSWDPEGRAAASAIKEQTVNTPWWMLSKEQPHQMFQMQPVEQADYPGRSDLFVGYTVLPTLWQRFHSPETVHSTDFSSCGETFCYLKIDGINGLEGSVFQDKSQIEDTLDEALRHFKVGCVFGSGTGLRYSYVDFAVTDAPMACGIIRKVLCAGKIPKRSWVLFFDSDNAEQWIGVWEDTPAPPQ
jgi:hypothetical protein